MAPTPVSAVTATLLTTAALFGTPFVWKQHSSQAKHNPEDLLFERKLHHSVLVEQPQENVAYPIQYNISAGRAMALAHGNSPEGIAVPSQLSPDAFWIIYPNDTTVAVSGNATLLVTSDVLDPSNHLHGSTADLAHWNAPEGIGVPSQVSPDAFLRIYPNDTTVAVSGNATQVVTSDVLDSFGSISWFHGRQVAMLSLVADVVIFFGYLFYRVGFRRQDRRGEPAVETRKKSPTVDLTETSHSIDIDSFVEQIDAGCGQDEIEPDTKTCERFLTEDGCDVDTRSSALSLGFSQHGPDEEDAKRVDSVEAAARAEVEVLPIEIQRSLPEDISATVRKANAERYKVIRGAGLPVTASYSRDSEVLRTLPKGESVEVLRDQKRDVDNRTRAPIHPTGWITLWMADGSQNFVEQEQYGIVQNKDSGFSDVVLWSLDRKSHQKVKNGEQVIIMDTSDDDFKVFWRGKEGWVKKHHIRASAGTSGPARPWYKKPYALLDANQQLVLGDSHKAQIAAETRVVKFCDDDSSLSTSQQLRRLIESQSRNDKGKVSLSESWTDESIRYLKKLYPTTKVAALNYANCTYVGGDYTDGGMTKAQEEEMCRLFPALFESLKKSDAGYVGGVDRKMTSYKKHEFGARFEDGYSKARNVLFTTEIECMRNGPVLDYKILKPKHIVKSGFVTAAVPLLGRGKDASFKAWLHRTDQGYEWYEKLFMNVFLAPKSVDPEYDVIIVGPIGCGAFGNDPSIIAQSFLNVIDKHNILKLYKEVHFCLGRSTGSTVGGSDKSNVAVFRRVLERIHYEDYTKDLDNQVQMWLDDEKNVEKE